jgi:hypothetical protein
VKNYFYYLETYYKEYKEIFAENKEIIIKMNNSIKDKINI